MQAWWDSLGLVLQILYCIAIPSSLILILQMVLTMMGGESDGGVDVSDTSGLDLSGDMDVDAAFDADLSGADGVDGDVMHDGGNPADFGALKFLTLQTIVTFTTVFGWVSIACISAKLPVPIGLLIALVCGLVMMFVVAKIVQASAKLAEDGTLNLKNALGQTATVYVAIPANSEGEGKVTMQLQGRFCEVDAITEEAEELASGTQVLVVDVRGDTLVVERNTIESE